MVVGANHFYPRPPRGGRHASRRHRQHRANFYPRPPRGGRQWGLDLRYFYCGISIHALREEGDTRAILTPTPGTDFYPRPPRGGRPSKAHHNTITSEFLSTPSARRATDKSLPARSHQHYFYPRPPRGGRLYELLCIYIDVMISIHALREEGDVATVSLLPLNSISIHALREEGDQSPRWFSEGDGCISIHALREEGDRKETAYLIVADAISIHALREEGDPEHQHL